MLGHRLPNIKPAFGEWLVRAVYQFIKHIWIEAQWAAKHEALTQYWFNVGPASRTPGEYEVLTLKALK